MNRLQRTIKALLGGLMPKFIDRTGQRFGRLLVTEEAGRNALKKVLWKCVCDCGNTAVRTSGDLVTGNSLSCGCYLKEKITKHGGWNKSSYNTWRAMLRRCNNPKDKDYKKYGAVGIKVCQQWNDYLQFEKDMGEPAGSETLDRINPYGDYSPENCRWASLPTQARNVRVRENNKSGHTGVHMRYKKWYGEITANKKKFYSAACNTIEEAIAARKELERIHWGVV
jgi:hypothetical protein